ncbi:MAG TPA: cytochrome c3 family protein [Gemmataceae bacterium]|nr:cytochrome c3 family protein [Gemmataceae bacterium]
MAQIFHRSFNVLSRLSIFGSIVILAGAAWAGLILLRSSYVTNIGVARTQPVQFSHAHHVNGLGIDCRYCHTSVEESSFAGIPPTKTCMNCHSQIWVGSPMLEPVRGSYARGDSIRWERVHQLADFVYFDHSIHVAKGVGCASCHGRVDEMQAVYQNGTLLMEWCLDCHRQPEKNVRPRDKVFVMDFRAEKLSPRELEALGFEGEGGQPLTQLRLGQKLVEKYHIRKLDECSACHR